MTLDPVELAMVGPFFLGDSQAIYSYEQVTQLGFKPSHFATRACAVVWEKIGSMLDDGTFTPERLLSFTLGSIDVASEPSERSVWINEASKAGSSSTMNIHAMEIMERHLRTETEISIASVKGDKGSEMLNDLENKLAELRAKVIVTKRDEKMEACQELRDEINACLDGLKRLRSSFIPVWDQCIGGLPDAQLIIVGGRPGCSKTSLCEQILDASVRNGIPALYIQRELARSRAIGRLACRGANVPWWKVEKRVFSRDEGNRLNQAIEEYESLPLYLDAISTCNGTTIGPTIRYHHKQHGIKLVVLDYVSLIEVPKGEQRWAAIGDLTRAMKRAANDTGATVIGIAQIGRDQEKRNEKPHLSDLRESGNIEQDADVILALWLQEDNENQSTYPVRWSVLKNRNGGKGSIDVMFDGPRLSFLGEATDEYGLGVKTVKEIPQRWDQE